MSRSGVNESIKWDFIKIILTKNQERSKRDKESVRIRKSRCIESDGTFAVQKSSMWLLVCVESWGSLSIFPRVS